ncbi:hypothetical protein LQW54_005138 [Pestalotiopsis sp. IQ-011]
MSNPPDKSISTLSPPGQTTSTPSPPGKSSFTPSPPSQSSTSAQHGTSAPHAADTSSAPPDTPRRKTAPPQRSNSPTIIPAGPHPGAGTPAVLQTQHVPEHMSVHRQTHGGSMCTGHVVGGSSSSRPEPTDAKRQEQAAPASDGGDSPVSLSPWGPEEEIVATEVWNDNKLIANPRKRSESTSEEE